MAFKDANGLAKVLGVVFTSVVAPVLVHVAIRDLKDDGDNASHDESVTAKRQETEKRGALSIPVVCPAPSPSHGALQGPPPVSRPLEMRQFICEGVGKTPEEGLEQALRLALAKAVAAELNGSKWAQREAAIVDFLMQEPGSLIRVVQELGTKKEWGLRGSLYHVQVALELNRSALVARLRAVLQQD